MIQKHTQYKHSSIGFLHQGKNGKGLVFNGDHVQIYLIWGRGVGWRDGKLWIDLTFYSLYQQLTIILILDPTGLRA